MVKPDALWSEEEGNSSKSMRKVKELNEERDKYRKNRRAENMAYLTKGLFQYLLNGISKGIFSSAFSNLRMLFQLNFQENLRK